MIPGSPATAPLRRLLTELAESGSTGALHVDGSPGGTFYLVSGRITHAWSPGCQDVGERLVRSGRLSAAIWRAAYDAGYADRTVGRRLVRDGQLVQGELVCRVLATICDAAHEILRTEHAQLRFVAEERHWLGLVTQVELTALSRETVRRRLLSPPTVETPTVAGPGTAQPRPVDLSDEPAVLVPSRGFEVGRPDGPWAGRPRHDAARRTPANVAPAQREPRPGSTPNSAPVPDYATLKRLRRALTAFE